MIRRLVLKNFQRHRNLTIKLDPGITTIVGESDVGKSTVLRALTWALTNRPHGAALKRAGFVRHGARETRVTVHLDKHTITRAKGKGRNFYKVDGKVHRAFGNEVPAEVSRLVNVGPLNFQLQHDRADGNGATFWLSMPPGEVSKRLNAIVDLSLIDTTLANLSRSSRRASIELDLMEERLRNTRREAEKLQPIKRVARDLKRLERAHAQHVQDRAWASRLHELVREGREHESRARVAPGPGLEAIEKQARTLERSRTKAERLARVIEHVESLEARVKELSREHRRTHRRLTAEMGETCLLCGQSVPDAS